MSNIILFVYNFPHKKSLKGMQLIKSYGLNDISVVAAPKKKLNFRQSKKRISIQEEELVNPFELALQYGWKALVADHNSKEALQFYNDIKPEYGIILGSRILSQEVINNFNAGIINFHPGVLPENRGLDNLKWAIYRNIPQGVTTHIIDKNIDMGEMIYKDYIEVNEEDTIFDVNSKLLDLQFKHLKILLDNNFDIGETSSLKSNNKSQKAVTDAIDKDIYNNFHQYKKKYSRILQNYKSVD